MPQGHGQDRHMPDGFLSTLVEGPAVPVLTTAEAKAHLRVDFADDDDLIAAYVQAATDMMDAQWGELGLALVTQRWQVTLPQWPVGNRLYFPINPVQQVFSITYYDAENAEQTLASDVYRLIVGQDEAYIELLEGETFPTVFDRPDAIAIQYDAGFGNAGTDVPEGIRTAARLLVGHWYETRTAVSGKTMSEVPMGVKSLLHKYRVVRGYI